MGARTLTVYDGVSGEKLARRLGVPRCVIRREASSALDITHDLAKLGAPDGTVVLVEQQLAGRGRHGRRWVSPPATGIWLGYLRRPGTSGEHGVLSLRVGLAVREALGELGVACRLKWPNDVLVCDRKVGGILCEGRGSSEDTRWVAIGVGINVHSPLPPAVSHSAVALDELWKAVSRIGVLEVLVPKFSVIGHSPELTEAELGTFAAADWLRGRMLSKPLRGIACGIANDGALLVETERGVERVLGGSVVAA